MKKLLLPALLILATIQTQAAIIQFDLIGTAGSGLLPGNETPGVTGGTGGEVSVGANGGIFYDDVTNLLTVNVAWGSGNGFTDLSSAVNNSHIHGPTPTANGFDGTANFRQTGAPVFVNLPRTSNNQSTGAISNQTVSFPTAQNEADLLNGKFYINVHTLNNGGGEIRGFLVQAVPEPGTASLLGLGALAFAARRRR